MCDAGGAWEAGDAPPVWTASARRDAPTAALVTAYGEQLALLRAAAAPSVTDRVRSALVERVTLLRIELRRRGVMPSSPREAVMRERAGCTR